jgi:hypothetical protein
MGGAICPACGEADTVAPPLSADVRDLLVVLLQTRLAEVSGLDAAPEMVASVLVLLRTFVAFHVPGRPRALEFFLTRG